MSLTECCRGFPITPQVRTIDKDGKTDILDAEPVVFPVPRDGAAPGRMEPVRADEAAAELPQKMTHILPYGVNKGKLQQVVRSTNAPVELVSDIKDADLLLTTKIYYRRKTQALRSAEDEGKPVYVLRRNTTPQIEQFVRAIGRKRSREQRGGGMAGGMQEAEEAAALIDRGETQVALNPRSAYVRHLQHQIAEKYGLASSSTGRDGRRHVVIYRA